MVQLRIGEVWMIFFHFVILVLADPDLYLELNDVQERKLTQLSLVSLCSQKMVSWIDCLCSLILCFVFVFEKGLVIWRIEFSHLLFINQSSKFGSLILECFNLGLIEGQLSSGSLLFIVWFHGEGCEARDVKIGFYLKNEEISIRSFPILITLFLSSF